ncbi:hypothetical protein [Sorangium sp. So ce204]|uniref:hypothetical protein n=1 Tax=Sorangium sp. So ce204 TaxID=3133288 RepID=UPI003F609E34
MIEFDTFDNTIMYACEYSGRLWGDGDGRVVWFNPRVSMSLILTHALCKGGGFIGSWRESVECRHQRLALYCSALPSGPIILGSDGGRTSPVEMVAHTPWSK